MFESQTDGRLPHAAASWPVPPPLPPLPPASPRWGNQAPEGCCRQSKSRVWYVTGRCPQRGWFVLGVGMDGSSPLWVAGSKDGLNVDNNLGWSSVIIVFIWNIHYTSKYKCKVVPKRAQYSLLWLFPLWSFTNLQTIYQCSLRGCRCTELFYSQKKASAVYSRVEL